ncbi:hypothetical protein PULV_a1321 [Pseudoalteromonas ulvae UL12]|uniref:TonB C-terminal domain-containing protein n=1 Tax=Pseudoalteromonas ulvae TaxID=107327 RepID=A0A244CSR1_PSEDV|nr:energy transducer TonB [Pseudoalteromonas ulvae]MBE0363824.1 hypothetical protein [Pseudoalteromonas ulvae UL12]OUL58660.1 hypothetical protein B1199_10120 [Pseudoalteromonas ulvae]
MKLNTYCLVALALSLASTTTLANNDSTTEQFKQAYKNYQQAVTNNQIDNKIKYAEQAYLIGQQLYGEQALNTANLALNYALSLPEAKSQISNKPLLEQKYALYKTILSIYSNHYEEEAIELVDVYFGLAKSTSSASESDDYFEHGLTLLPKKSKLLADSYSEASMHLFNHHQFEKYKVARKYAYEADELYRELLPENSFERAKSNYLIGMIAQGMRKKNEAIKRFNEVVDVFDKHLDFDHPFELAAHSRLIDLYEDQGKSEEATKHCIAIAKMVPWKDELEQTPLHRTNPDYPISMVKRGKDGFAQLEFDITPAGFVDNIRVLDKSNEAFAKESIKALKKWRYAPKFENGQAITATAQVQIDFQLSRG